MWGRGVRFSIAADIIITYLGKIPTFSYFKTSLHRLTKRKYIFKQTVILNGVYYFERIIIILLLRIRLKIATKIKQSTI